MRETVDYHYQRHELYHPSRIAELGADMFFARGLDWMYEPIDATEADVYLHEIFDSFNVYAELHGVDLREQKREYNGSEPRYLEAISFGADIGDGDEVRGRIAHHPARNSVGYSPKPDRISVRFKLDSENPVHAEFHDDMSRVIEHIPEDVPELDVYRVIG